uniref:GDSL esterase/lipase n=1 Tax=Kalanchoe fedtschenkoi TaxID=63787 RepID=A0A7N1A7K7_KALFE
MAPPPRCRIHLSCPVIGLLTLLLQCCLTIEVNRVNATTPQQELLPSFPAILAFGDSTVDTGNNNHIPTVFRADHPPYGQDFPSSIPTGRFSNGKLTIDMLASALNIKPLVPPFLDPNLAPQDLLTGVSFASGGSGYDRATDFAVSIPVDAQLHNFNKYKTKLCELVGEDESQKILKNALVVISTGSNDFAFNYYAYPVKLFQRLSVGGYQDFVQSKMQSHVKSLYEMGCQKMMVVGLPPMGCLPITMTLRLSDAECVKEQNDDARVYNKKLKRQILNMEKQLPGIKISYADIYKPLFDMIHNPSKYGFEATNAGCCGTGLLEAGPLCNMLSAACADSSKYVFWDAIHPTEAAYAYITRSIMAQFLAHLS